MIWINEVIIVIDIVSLSGMKKDNLNQTMNKKQLFLYLDLLLCNTITNRPCDGVTEGSDALVTQWALQGYFMSLSTGDALRAPQGPACCGSVILVWSGLGSPAA